jgi:phage shock protein A
MENQNQDQPIRKDSNKIYFLVAVILALLGTNAYLFFKDKKANDRIVTISDEKTRMQTEIDKIEAELDNASGNNIKLSEQMQNEQAIAREKIGELRTALKKGQLTQGQLAKAQEDIKQLRYFVTKYTADIDQLKKQNASLTTERDELKTTIDSVSSKASDLERQNQELNTKVQAAAALKTGNVSITAFTIRNNGKESVVTRASTAEKIRINFSAVNNSIAEKGLHDIYIRVIDPSGNLIMSNNGGMFNADDEELQYTYKTAIEFANDGKGYAIDWANPGKFQKGTYTAVLYADGYTMGKGAVTLR